MAVPPCKDGVYSVDDRRTAGCNEHESDVDVEDASTGSNTPDNTGVTDEGNHFRGHLSAFSRGTYTQNVKPAMIMIIISIITLIISIIIITIKHHVN